MSHIAVDLKVIEVHAPAVARVMEEPVAVTLGGLSLLWHRCWSTQQDTISRIGLGGIFGMERIDLRIEALADAGFLEPLAEGFRVRGAQKYLRIRQGNSKGGKAASGNLKRGTRKAGREPEGEPGTEPGGSREVSRDQAGEGPRLIAGSTPSTEHRAPNTITTKSTAPAPRAPRDSDLLCADFESLTGSPYGWNGAKDGVALAWCLKQAPLEEVRARWRRGLAADGWLLVRTVAQLRSKWNDLAPPPSGLGVFTANSISEGM